MKKLIAVLIFLIACLGLNAKLNFRYFGIKGGVNFSRISFINEFEKKGLIIGGFFRFDLSERISIQPEIFYSMKGISSSWKDSFSGHVFKYKSALELDYLEVPVLLKLKMSKKGKFKPSIFVGPYIAFRITAKSVWEVVEEATGEIVEDESRVEDVEGLKGIEFGITLGLSLDIEISSGCIILDARYTMGISSIYKYISDDEPVVSIKNYVISLMIGYAFK